MTRYNWHQAPTPWHTKLPRDVASCRVVELHLHSDHGAGLDLERCSHGQLVVGVDAVPGQDLTEGDVIVEIDDVPLWGVEALDVAFGRRFADGARLRVARHDSVACRPLWQPLGFGLGGRSKVLRDNLRQDLAIMGRRCGLHVELKEHTGVVVLHGPSASAQRWAADELTSLVSFYFPERAGNPTLPLGYWYGERDASSQVLAVPDPQVEGGFGDWQTAPIPNVILSHALGVVILVGVPGSGKSTLAERLSRTGWIVVNQDALGDRKRCVAAARAELAAGRRVVIDRCNISRLQRKVWLRIADDHSAGVGCVWLDVDPEECGQRVLQRFGHPTLPAEDSSLAVIDDCQNSLERPMEAEGFVLWHANRDEELDHAVLALTHLADRPAVECQRAGRPQRSDSVPSVSAKPAGKFQYHDVRQRGHYLRAVRQQVEYYFSDLNLRRDWSFLEKILETPEEGWLELRWILSRPRMERVYQATAADLLEALGPSTLIVREKDGTHWICRGRPLPKLFEQRPAYGQESERYTRFKQEDEMSAEAVTIAGLLCDQQRAVQDPSPSLKQSSADCHKQLECEVQSKEAPAAVSVPSAGVTTCTVATVQVQCAACGQSLARTGFSKAQLTKHRNRPTCKDCVENSVTG